MFWQFTILARYFCTVPFAKSQSEQVTNADGIGNLFLLTWLTQSESLSCEREVRTVLQLFPYSLNFLKSNGREVDGGFGVGRWKG